MASACSRVGRPAGRSGTGIGSGTGHATAGQTAFGGHGGEGQAATAVDAVVEDRLVERAVVTAPPPLTSHPALATGVSGAGGVVLDGVAGATHPALPPASGPKYHGRPG